MQPPASLKALADPIYEAFYGLRDQPFAITTDPKFFYLSRAHQQAFSELLNGLRRREGILLLTGEIGTGKTTLCRAVLETLGPRTFASMILNPYMTGAEVFRVVLRDFGLVSHDELRRGTLATADVPQLADALERFLRSLATLDSHAVIVLDEAQSLAPRVLDEIRLLTAIEKDNRRLVQIVLCGQPGLLSTLGSASLSALNDRITRRIRLGPLAPDEVEQYIQHRLAIAGGTSTVRFAPGSARVVADVADSLPRRINVLCDRALQEGRIAGVNVITDEIVRRAARSLTGQASSAVPDATNESLAAAAPSSSEAATAHNRWRWVAYALAGVVLLSALVGGYTYYGYSTWSGLVVPSGPPAPARDVGTPAGPLAAPVDLESIRPRVPVAIPEIPESSGQLPGNTDQLN